MTPRTLIVVGLAMVCGLLAAVGVKAMNNGKGNAPPVETVPVVLAAADIQRGETIRETMLEVKQFPKDQVPPGAVSKVSELTDRVAHIPMLKGDVVAEARLSPKGSGSGMAALIRPGMRAFTIQTPTLSSSIAGFLLPGNRVDVILTMNVPILPDDETGGVTTTTLLQNIEILAVHTTVDSPSNNKIDPDQARSVTLMVTPSQASLLDLGQNKGTLHLSLRNVKDDGQEKPKPASLADLQLPREKKAKPPEPPAVVAKAPEVFKEPEPLPIRTLRGTHSGFDTMRYRPAAPAPSPNPALLAGDVGTGAASPTQRLNDEGINAGLHRRGQ